MHQLPPLRKRLLVNMLPRLSGLIAIISIMLITVAVYFVRQHVSNLQYQSVDGLKQDLTFVAGDTLHQLSNIAANDIIINSLIDFEQRDQYLPMFFRSLNLTHARNVSIALYDFSGEIVVQKSWEDVVLADVSPAWKQQTLNFSKSYYSIADSGVFFSVPVLIGGAAEGALVLYVENLQALLAPHPTLTDQVITDSEGRVLFSSTPTLVELGSLFANFNTRNHIIYDSTWQNLSLYSVMPISTAYQVLYWLVPVMIALIAGMFLVNLHMIRTTGSLAESTLSKLYKDIESRLKNGTNEDLLQADDDTRELMDIRNAFDKLIWDLTEVSLSNEQFSNVIDSMGDMLFVVDTHNRVILSNKQFDSFCEKQYSEIEGTIGYIIKQMRNRTEAELKHFLSGEKNERRIQWSNTALEDTNNTIRGTIFVGTDITEQRTLESHVQILRHAINESTVSIIIADIESAAQPIIYANKAFSRLTGYDKEDIIGQNCRIMQGRDTDKHATSSINLAIKNRQAIETTLLNYRKNGTSFYNQVILTPVNIDGKVTHYIGFQQDVTEQRLAKRYLQDAKQKAEESARMKSGFLASMSHEIRTPIHGISGVLQLLSNSHLNDEQKHYLSLAKYSIEGLLHIVNDILDFSKIEAGQLQIEQQPFDILEALESLQSQYAILCQEKGLTLHFHFNLQNFHVVLGDSVRFRQILSNLIGNAVKFTQQGLIDVTTSIEKISEGSLRLKCSVKDTGIGIANDKKDGIFNVFSQEDLSTTRKFGGTGLGLSISKQLCELMGGRIYVDSAKNVGSTFTFHIVLKECHDTLIEPTKNSHSLLALQDRKWKVLIVEDNDINQVIVKQHLSHHKTLSAKSGIEALQALNKMKVTFDVILMDCQMPDMDGFEATRRIRKGEAGDRYLHIPIIALTANAMKGDKETCYEAGMDDYLSKPFDAHDLAEKVAYWAEQ